MGWSNYIVIDDWKLLLEVPREISEEDYFFNDNMKKLLTHMESVDYDLFDTKIKDITIDNLSEVFGIAKKVMFIDSECSDIDIKMFLYFLKVRRINYRIEHEDVVRDKYKDYKKTKW